jgi:predicted GNAT family N-acyltransferase
MIQILITDYLSEDAKRIREEVFIQEQKFTLEFDEIDEYAKCVVLYVDGVAVACCRYFQEGEDGDYIVGRIAVRREYSGRHFGELILREVETRIKKAGGRKISISAQFRVKEFYSKLGFVESGNLYYDEYCEHIHMEKEII